MRGLRSYVLVFLALAVPFGVVTGCYAGWWLDSASSGVLSGLALGGTVGGFPAGLLGALDQVGDRWARPGEHARRA